MKRGFYVHPTAEVSADALVGGGTRIWHQAQVREKARIGVNCVIGKGAYIDYGVSVGDNVKIQNYASVYRGVTIEDDVLVGAGVCFTNDKYPRALIWNPEDAIETKVRKGASIGANATILCGITIGEHAMIGAGSVVTKDVPKHALVYGNPAEFKGFVCDCGKKLIKKDKAHRCGSCGKSFKLK
jgi:acetyltransferase-like isoleucine patch superfamily enzyme